MGSLGLQEIILIIAGALIWAVVIAAAVSFVLWLKAQARRAGREATATQDAPVEILKKRYARGEITREQYEQMKHDLEG